MKLSIENVPVTWITPAEQFMRLTQSKVVFGSSMLRRTDSLLDTNLIHCITDYFVELLPQLTNWHIALKKLDLLPDLVPALPDHILDILYSNCPIVEGKKVFDTHSLYLIPLNSLNDLEARVSAYGRDVLGAQIDGENPLRFRNFYQRNRFGHIESKNWEWVLVPNTIIEESRDKCYQEQVKIIEKLNQKSGADYEVGTVRQMVAFLFFHKVATGASAWQPYGSSLESRPLDN